MLSEFAKIFEHVERAVLMLQLSGEIIAANKAARRLMGDPLPHNITELFENGAPVGQRSLLNNLLSSKHLKVSAKLLRVGPCELDFALVEDQEQPLALVELNSLAAPDEPVQRHYYQRKKESLEAFLHSASHDLRSPLVGLRGFIDALKEDYGQQLDARGQEYIELILSSSRRIEKILSGLSEYIRLDRSLGDRSLINSARVLSEALLVMETDIRTRAAQINVVTDLPEIYCDPERIKAVFVNLIANAIHFTPRARNPQVVIGCQRHGEEYQFSVSDYGIGIEAKYLGKVFNPFFRVKAMREAEGSGLGLAIIKQIIEDHGGRVWAESDPGQGSCFYFTLSATTGDGAGDGND